jgi:hypothetical protein
MSRPAKEQAEGFEMLEHCMTWILLGAQGRLLIGDRIA